MDATNSQSAPRRGTGLWIWIFLALAAALVFGYLLVDGRFRVSSGTEGPAIGRRLPYLQLEGLTGNSHGVSLDDVAGHVTLVNYWGTWCPPCQREFPHIVELAEKFGNNDDFRLYAVSCDGQSDADLDRLRSETEMFLKSRQVSLPTYADHNAASRHAMQVSLGLEGFGYPTTLVLDRQGTIRGFWVGYAPGTEREMQSLIEDLLQKPAAQPAS